MPRLLRHLLLLICVSCADGCIVHRMILGTGLSGTNQGDMDPQGAQRKILHVGSHTVECWLARSPGAAKCEPTEFLLLFTGRGDRAEEWAGPLAKAQGDRRVECWVMNYPGFGGSDGPAQLDLIAPYALGTYDALKQVAGDRPIYIQAQSLGTVTSLCVASRRPIAGMYLQKPPPLPQLIRGTLGWWNFGLLSEPMARMIPPELDSIANARNVTAPAVFVVAEADEVIPPEYAEMVVSAYAGPKRVLRIPGMHHHDLMANMAPAQLASAKAWMWETATKKGDSHEDKRESGVATK